MQTLNIVAEFPERFKIVGLAAGSNVTLLADQVINTTTRKMKFRSVTKSLKFCHKPI